MEVQFLLSMLYGRPPCLQSTGYHSAKSYNIEPRPPAAFFVESEGHHNLCTPKEWSFIKILIDGKSQNVVDDDGNVLPSLVYMAREKRPQYHHNFKSWAMNALICNNPIILNVDCDMYSNNSDSIRGTLCFFLDEEMGHKIGFVQYPQNYNNMTKNNIYGNSLLVLNEVILCGMIVITSIPIYEAMFLRKDKGRIPSSVTLASLGFVMLAFLIKY
ncbi:hypothetical protein OsJ_29755 [Oryza sativa Japonica Group]|uniref:Uncharacterized protein n=1 Tax=Oryza sativa subsp. japonica TaxID=39947 RepID=B9G462_ORYSJ|nr:hypothetical protein OsJ_29755 [Oryza sativa Japonica Group]